MRKRFLIAALASIFVCAGVSLSGAQTLAPQADIGLEQAAANPQWLARENSPRQVNLVVETGKGGRAISGEHRFGASRLRFSAQIESEDSAVARFWIAEGSFEATSRIVSRREGWMEVGDMLISGRGAIDEAATQALEELVSSGIGEQLALAALELGCQITGAETAPLLAAFTQPWQILYKHTGRLVADASTLRLSAGCAYGVAASPGHLLSLSQGDPVAHVPRFMTLDGEGAAAAALTTKSSAPCGAKCRGACGADCSSPRCSGGCEYLCPTHSFCRWHDSCYDGCNAAFGCWSISSWLCKRNCDDRCLVLYSSSTCAAWANGFGPSDGWRTYDECIGGSGGNGDGGDGGDGGPSSGGCSQTTTCVDCPLANCDYCECDDQV